MGKTRINKATLEFADNGYILHLQNPNLVLVYEGEALPEGLLREILSDIEDALDSGEASKFNITVTIESLNYDTEGEDSSSYNIC